MLNSHGILNLLYNNIKTTLVLDSKYKNDSVIISFLEIKSNSRFRYINNSSEKLSTAYREEIDNLVKNDFIRQTEEINHYAITGKGVWEIEKENSKSLVEVIEFIDKKYFDISLSNERITDKERIILLSLIAARAFSEDSSINLKNESYTLDACKRIIDKSNEKLYELGLVKKLSGMSLYGKKGNEHIVSNLIRHTDSLPKKTKGIYTAGGNQKYYLDIIENNTINVERLSFIVQSIFSNNLDINYDNFNGISTLCKTIAYDEAPYLYEQLDNTFAKPSYDDQISIAFKKAMFYM